MGEFYQFFKRQTTSLYLKLNFKRSMRSNVTSIIKIYNYPEFPDPYITIITIRKARENVTPQQIQQILNIHKKSKNVIIMYNISNVKRGFSTLKLGKKLEII